MTPRLGVARYTTQAQRESFQENGYVVISGLLSEEEAKELVVAGESVVKKDNRKSTLYFQIAERGIMICGPSNPDLDDKSRTGIIAAFRNVAVRSRIPHAAAELMGLDPNEETVKILRDLFLGKSVDEGKTCGWHVDDHSFWPEDYSNSSPSADGINAWIAMQDMPAKFGGSLALAPGSHKADYRFAAYSSLGLDLSVPGQSKEEIYKSIKQNGFRSCTLHQTSPELHEKMEKVAFVPDLKCGDVIFHTRWLFHKTAPLNDDGREHFRENGLLCLNRYSVRYVPGTARLPQGFVNEWSMLSDSSNAGKMLKDVSGDWYPTVWPGIDDDLDTKLFNLATGKVPEAAKIMKSNLDELLKILNSS
jgi:hypothetical protein